MDPIKISKFAQSLKFVPIPLCGILPVHLNWEKIKMTTCQKIVSKHCKEYRCNNIGILTGRASNVVVVRLNVIRGGLSSWNYLLSLYKFVPNTLIIQTGDGNYDIYFKYNNNISHLQNRIGDNGIEFYTHKKYVVFAGSVHPLTGLPYQIINGYCPHTGSISLTEIPVWLSSYLSS
ncbi:DNA primase [Orpheovirus IHUMI-LCC2]|uniref:Bifunctional DNA primase/polymerase n=1 Tax=Orpheovirus IHUMI-LCC2 TaxID=2023057 RepID=A0A2I2L5Q6_9VIRU|nr:DNA primase [Orpheovirus IHUMI-LCC2]SNW62830.1 Bifunctional DNA primase/polymerase [Orpheovirus IHUMI-LCC2]